MIKNKQKLKLRFFQTSTSLGQFLNEEWLFKFLIKVFLKTKKTLILKIKVVPKIKYHFNEKCLCKTIL